MQRNINQEVLQTLNLARTRPAEIKKHVEKQLAGFIDDRHYMVNANTRMITKEGQAAWKEAIQFLTNQKPMQPFRWSQGLFCSAMDHAKDMGQNGKTGHTGTDGSSNSQRIERYGKWQHKCGENISYGNADPLGIVMQLIIDDGVKTRGHRRNIFSPDFKVVGCAVCKHKGWKVICVMDFAGGMDNKKTATEKASTCKPQPIFKPKQFKPEKKKQKAMKKEGLAKEDDFDYGKMMMSTGHHWASQKEDRVMVSQKVKTMTRTKNGQTTKTVTTIKIYSNGDRQQSTQTTTS